MAVNMTDMEYYRLQCLHDPIMQSLYRNEIRWSDVPEDDPPLEVAGWKDYLTRSTARQLTTELERIRPKPLKSQSVPNSPNPSRKTYTELLQSAPSTPNPSLRQELFPPSPSIVSTPSTAGTPPATPALLPLRTPAILPLPSPPTLTAIPPTLTAFTPITLPPTAVSSIHHRSVKRFAPRILDAIREVDSAAGTPERTPSPAPPLKGAWANRAQLKTLVDAAPILSSPVPQGVVRFRIRSIPFEVTSEEIRAALRMLSIHPEAILIRPYRQGRRAVDLVLPRVPEWIRVLSQTPLVLRRTLYSAHPLP